MSAFKVAFDRFIVNGYGVLLLKDGRGWFEVGLDDDGVTVADAAENASGMVAGKALRGDGVVVLAAFEVGAGNPVSDLDCFGGIDAHHGIGKQGIEFVVKWFAKSCRYTCSGGEYHTTYGIMCLFCVEYCFLLFCFFVGVKGTEFGGFGMVKIDGLCFDAIDFTQTALNGNAHLFEHQFGNGTTRNPCSSLSSRTSSATAVVTQTILVKVGKVRMSGAEEVFDILVVLALLVGVEDHHGNRGSGTHPFKDT